MTTEVAAPPRTAGTRRTPLRTLTLTELTLFVREKAGLFWGIGFPVVLLIVSIMRPSTSVLCSVWGRRGPRNASFSTAVILVACEVTAHHPVGVICALRREDSGLRTGPVETPCSGDVRSPRPSGASI